MGRRSAAGDLLGSWPMVIRDPVHGDIDLSPRASAVLDFPEVQRLRGIKQLGTASFVYPGANHTRFDHSLGASHVARGIVERLRGGGTTVDIDLEDAVVASALLHDVTHLPFGHTLEDERRLFARHDKGDRFERLFAAGLADRLDRLGLRELVGAILGVESPDAAPRWCRDIVSSTIDADLLDYLRRDAYFTGIVQSYDPRVFRYFTVADGRLAIDMYKHGMERPDARSEIVQVLRMRYFLTERIYYHHTKVAAGAMISKAVELAGDHAGFTEDELLRSTDSQLLAALADAGEGAAGLVARLNARHLLKRAYAVSAATVPLSVRKTLVDRYHHSAANRRAAEEFLAREAGCAADSVIVYCPALTVMKEAAALVRAPHGLLALNDSEKLPSMEIQALESRYAALWRFFVFAPEEARDAIAGPAKEIFGIPTELALAARQAR